MTELSGVSRSSFYRFDGERQEPRQDPGDMEVRDAIHRIALEWPSYGRPRITKELRRQGWQVNHKRVGRILAEDNLLCLRKRKFIVSTTDSRHGRKVYPNLAKDLELTGIDQLWVADITYIRLQEEFVYLAVVLDAYSRRVIGWALDRTIEDDLTLSALQMALAQRRPGPGLVHHSDRGSQYASNDYTDLLKSRGVEISMSRKGNPWDNAACESFIKTLKYEEVLRRASIQYERAARHRSALRSHPRHELFEDPIAALFHHSQRQFVPCLIICCRIAGDRLAGLLPVANAFTGLRPKAGRQLPQQI
jgi:transposase InsO family protein